MQPGLVQVEVDHVLHDTGRRVGRVRRRQPRRRADLGRFRRSGPPRADRPFRRGARARRRSRRCVAGVRTVWHEAGWPGAPHLTALAHYDPRRLDATALAVDTWEYYAFAGEYGLSSTRAGRGLAVRVQADPVDALVWLVRVSERELNPHAAELRLCDLSAKAVSNRAGQSPTMCPRGDLRTDHMPCSRPLVNARRHVRPPRGGCHRFSGKLSS